MQSATAGVRAVDRAKWRGQCPVAHQLQRLQSAAAGRLNCHPFPILGGVPSPQCPPVLASISRLQWQLHDAGLGVPQFSSADMLRRKLVANGAIPSARPQRASRPASTGRAICVRLCDGYYFPIEYSASRRRMKVDEQACQSMYVGKDQAELFTYDPDKYPPRLHCRVCRSCRNRFHGADIGQPSKIATAYHRDRSRHGDHGRCDRRSMGPANSRCGDRISRTKRRPPASPRRFQEADKSRCRKRPAGDARVQPHFGAPEQMTMIAGRDAPRREPARIIRPDFRTDLPL